MAQIVAMSAMTKNPNMKTLILNDHVHEDHDDQCSEDCVGHVFAFPLYKLIVFRVFFGSYGIAPSSVIGLHDCVSASVISPFERRRGVSPMFIFAFSSTLVRACAVVLFALEAALHGCAIIQFSCGTQVTFRFLEFL